MPTCEHCGQEIEFYEGNVNAWVETRSGDDGGYYDVCPENPSGEVDAEHEPSKEVPRPYHRWRMNEDVSFGYARGDYCLACGVRRYPVPDDLNGEATKVASGPCPGDRAWQIAATRSTAEGEGRA
jgi:hypothetical protein